jgi:thiol-disulfide isomerase/thioredoxin
MAVAEKEIEQRVIYLPIYLLLFSLAVIFIWQNTRDRTIKSSKGGESSLDTSKPAPLFTLPNLNGENISLTDFKGKIVFLNFWATWCPPCAEEMPSMG